MKSKILFIMHMPPPVHGAAMVGKMIHDSKEINDAFDCKYINLSGSSSVAEVGKFNLHKVKIVFKKLYLMLKTVKEWKPDLVYFTAGIGGPQMYVGAFYLHFIRKYQPHIILHLHNKGASEYSKKDPFAKFGFREIFKKTKVILLSEALYPDVQQYVKHEDVYICPNGIPDTLDGKEPSAERHNKIPYILFLSNLLVSKGVIVLLDALKILKDRGYSFICDFVGGESSEIDAERFKREVEERGLNQVAIYDGKKYGEDKEQYFNNADIFAFPTYYHAETFGLVNLEAMEHKVPIVSTNEGGIPDVLKNGENGLISEKKNPLSLADCLAELLDSKELREKMGEDGYKKFKENYTIKSFEARLIEILKDASTGWGGVAVNLVRYFGRKFGENKEPFFNSDDIFVFPTLNESFGLVLLESMEHAMSCITTREGGTVDIVKDGETGLFSEKQDPNDLADKIETLINDADLRRNMGMHGRKRYKELFTQEAFIHHLRSILQKELN
jgi:glycosyltransferase involved in cell wall biosynthesis